MNSPKKIDAKESSNQMRKYKKFEEISLKMVEEALGVKIKRNAILTINDRQFHIDGFFISGGVLSIVDVKMTEFLTGESISKFSILAEYLYSNIPALQKVGMERVFDIQPAIIIPKGAKIHKSAKELLMKNHVNIFRVDEVERVFAGDMNDYD